MSHLRYALAVVIALPLLSACLSPLDTLGNETIVTEDEQLQKERRIEDDRIEDKHPVYDPDRTVVETFESCTFTLNKSASVAKLDIVPFGEEEQGLEGALFRGREEAIAAAQATRKADVVPSMEIVNGAMKPFNDGLYASIELGMQQGPEGKEALLRGLLDGLLAELAVASAAEATHLEDAAVFVATAMTLGDERPATLPAALEVRMDAEVSRFRANKFLSRPIGFYGWNGDLESIFSQDRYLQNRENRLSFGAAVALAAVLEADPALQSAYERAVALYAGLTNPYSSHPLTALFPYVDGFGSLADADAIRLQFEAENSARYVCTGSVLAFLPASRSKDTDYFAQKYCGSRVPKDASLIDELIDAIRDGSLDLEPNPDSGWYDFQLYAMETLLVPEKGLEKDHLLLTAAYKKKLIETFKSLITQTRETHVKQLDTFMEGVSMEVREIDLYPKLPVEPFPTFYLRTARAYRFLSAYLATVFEPGFLSGRERLLVDGSPTGIPLDAELRRMAELLYGLYFVSADSVGLDPEEALLADELAEFTRTDCVARANEWLAGWMSDRDVLEDPRVIVPIGRTDNGETTIYWATIGVKVYKASAEYVADYEPEVVRSEGCKLREWKPRDYYLLSEQMVEVRIPTATPPPTRSELRRICDDEKTQDDIVQALEAL